jgi:hypothetical protein
MISNLSLQRRTRTVQSHEMCLLSNKQMMLEELILLSETSSMHASFSQLPTRTITHACRSVVAWQGTALE